MKQNTVIAITSASALAFLLLRKKRNGAVGAIYKPLFT